jgi:dTDP-D-glucose 4,6-dehydratase
MRTGVGGVLVLLEAAHEHGVRRFVQVSTDEAYGDIESGASSEHLKQARLRRAAPMQPPKQVEIFWFERSE